MKPLNPYSRQNFDNVELSPGLNPYLYPRRSGLNQGFNYMNENATEEFNNKNETDLIENLIIEQFQQFGNKFVYLPRQFNNNVDAILGEQPGAVFDKSFEIEMMMNNPEGIEDDPNISPFGFLYVGVTEISVSRKRLKEELLKLDIGQEAANVGDILYFPMISRYFQINGVDYHYRFFYGGGVPMVTKLKCQVLDKGSEVYDLPNEEQITEFMKNFTENYVEPFQSNEQSEIESKEETYAPEPSYWPLIRGKTNNVK